MAAAPRKAALVTGANKGIGLAIAKGLLSARAWDGSEFLVLLAARSRERGEEAVKALKEESGKANVSFLQLDVTDEKSVSDAAAAVRNTYGGLDVLVNNAGIAYRGDAFDEIVAKDTLGTNFWGAKRVCDHFLPLMRPNGRVVNISSMSGVRALQRMSSELRRRFLNRQLTVRELCSLVEDFVRDIASETWREKGWPGNTYGTSKAALTALTRIQARDNVTPGLLINSCCPGWVRTDMGGANAAKSTEEGAETPLHLCLLPPNSPTGEFWTDKKVIDLTRETS